MIPWEALLAAALLAFYLQDSMLLLHYDELVVTESRRGWRVSTGPGVELAGRYLYLPNPLFPARRLFRASWLAAGPARPDDAQDARRHAARLSLLKLGSAVCWGLLLLALPILLLWYPHPRALVALLVVVYTTISLMIAGLYRRRQALGLTGTEVAALGAEALLCPPYAINLVRKVCLRRGLGQDPIVFAAAALCSSDRTALCAFIESRIEMAAGFEIAAGSREAVLFANRQRIREVLQ